MADTPADTSAITQGLSDPASMSADGQSVGTKSISDLVLGIQFQAAAVAATLHHRGLRITKIRRPAQHSGHAGPCGGCCGGGGPGCFC